MAFEIIVIRIFAWVSLAVSVFVLFALAVNEIGFLIGLGFFLAALFNWAIMLAFALLVESSVTSARRLRHLEEALEDSRRARDHEGFKRRWSGTVAKKNDEPYDDAAYWAARREGEKGRAGE